MIRSTPASSSSTSAQRRPAPAGARLWAALIGTLLVCAAALLWWGLGSTPADTLGPRQPAPSASHDAAAPRSQASPTVTSSTSPPGADQDLLDEGGGEPTWSTPTSRAHASAQAAQDAIWVRRTTAFLQAFARPPAGVSAGQWWQRVRPLMSPQAAQDYAATDPARVQFTAVTGTGAVVEPDEGVDDEGSVQVGVPTDDGWYLVTFDRDGAVTHLGPLPGSVSVEGSSAAEPADDGHGTGGAGPGEGGRGSLGAGS